MGRSLVSISPSSFIFLATLSTSFMSVKSFVYIHITLGLPMFPSSGATLAAIPKSPSAVARATTFQTASTSIPGENNNHCTFSPRPPVTIRSTYLASSTMQVYSQLLQLQDNFLPLPVHSPRDSHRLPPFLFPNSLLRLLKLLKKLLS